VWTT